MIRLFLFCALLLACAQAWCAAEIEGPNLIANGNFDDAGDGVRSPFSGWTGRAGKSQAYVFSKVPGRTGNAAQISGSKAERGDIHNSQAFSAKAGESLLVRFWAKTENLKGGTYASLEGEPNEDGWHKINIENSTDWKLYENRVKVPKGAKGQSEPKVLIWFYHFGTGALLIDDVKICIVTDDPVARAKDDLTQLRSMVRFTPGDGVRKVLEKIETALAAPTPQAAVELRGELLARVSEQRGGGGRFVVGATHNLDRVFLDEPFRASLPESLHLALARNETEAFQLAIGSCGAALDSVSVSHSGSAGGAQIRVHVQGFVDTTEGKRPYQSPRLGWWPDPLLPNAPFAIKSGETQPVLVTVSAPRDAKPGKHRSEISVKSGQNTVTLPLEIEIFNFELPMTGNYSSWTSGCSPEILAKHYGADPGEKIAERFAIAASTRRMPMIDLLNGWGWKTANNSGPARRTSAGTWFPAS